MECVIKNGKSGVWKMNKKELKDFIERHFDDTIEEIYRAGLDLTDKEVKRLLRLLESNIKDLALDLYYINDNPPLKFEELKEGSWVWDNKMKEYIKCAPGINSLNELCALYWYTSFNLDGELEEDYIKFEENRFYRREVNNDE